MTSPTAEQMAELQKKATPGPWEVGGPYPGTSVIVCIDGGSCGWGEAPEPPAYEPICILDQRTEGVPNEQARLNAAFIAAASRYDFTTANERRVRELEGHLSDAYRLLAKHEEEIERLKVARRAAVDEIIDGWREQDALASQAGQVEQNPEAAYDHMRQWLTSVLQSHFQESGK